MGRPLQVVHFPEPQAGALGSLKLTLEQVALPLGLSLLGAIKGQLTETLHWPGTWGGFDDQQQFRWGN